MNKIQIERWEKASNPQLSQELMMEFSYSEDLHLLRLVSENLSAPEQVLNRLAQHRSPYVRYGVGRNVNITRDTLAYLSKSSEYDVLRLVIQNPNTYEQTMLSVIMGSHKRQGSLNSLGCANIALSTPCISRLIPTACPNMKRGFAINENTSINDLCTLAKDSPYVRVAVAQRHHIPKAVYEILMFDSDLDVKKALIENESLPIKVIEHIFDSLPHRTIEVIAYNEHLSHVVKKKIIYSEHSYAKVVLLNNYNLDTTELAYLADDENHQVRIEVAKQDNVSVETLDKLKNDLSSQVVIEVIRNKSVSVQSLSYLSEHPNYVVRQEIAKKETITEDIIYDLSADSSPKVKIALITNPRALLSVVSELVYDLDEGVSRLARRLVRKEKVISNKYEYMAV